MRATAAVGGAITAAAAAACAASAGIAAAAAAVAVAGSSPTNPPSAPAPIGCGDEDEELVGTTVPSSPRIRRCKRRSSVFCRDMPFFLISPAVYVDVC